MPPPPPDTPVVLNITSSSVKLAWNYTGNASSAPIKSFVVQYRRNDSLDDFEEVTVQKPNIFVDGLEANTAYEFGIFSVSDIGQSRDATSTVVTTDHAGQKSVSVKFFLLFTDWWLVQPVKCFQTNALLLLPVNQMVCHFIQSTAAPFGSLIDCLHVCSRAGINSVSETHYFHFTT